MRLRTHQWHDVSLPGSIYIEEQCAGFEACSARRRRTVMSGEAAWEYLFPDGKWAPSPLAGTDAPCNGPLEKRS